MKKPWKIDPDLFNRIEAHYGGFGTLIQQDGMWVVKITNRTNARNQWFHPPKNQQLDRAVEWAFQLSEEQSLTMVCLLPAAVNRQWFYTVWENARSILFLRGDVAPYPACIAVFAPLHSSRGTDGRPFSTDVPMWGPDCDLGFEVRR